VIDLGSLLASYTKHATVIFLFGIIPLVYQSHYTTTGKGELVEAILHRSEIASECDGTLLKLWAKPCVVVFVSRKQNQRKQLRKFSHLPPKKGRKKRGGRVGTTYQTTTQAICETDTSTRATRVTDTLTQATRMTDTSTQAIRDTDTSTQATRDTDTSTWATRETDTSTRAT
jgi:hypothetical protein